jgi:maltose alpha-D-glucosyltransferase / alpha-amylase
MPARKKQAVTQEDPLWYKDGIIYQLHVRSFFDSSDDGVGDFVGLTQKLDYLQDLGVTALWLLPFYPSPLRDDGYDIAAYTGVHPMYGTLNDFRTFLKEAHKRGLKVITELVINHTSDQHPWFQRSRRAKPGSYWRNFYVWSDTPEKYKDARIIFKDFETSNWSWDPIAKAYYWHRFYSHQPDLNFEHPAVQKSVLQVMDFWMGMGVDGVRLDAIPYLYEEEGTSCENLPRTHVFLKSLRAHLDRGFENRMLLAEANQWPEDALPYFGDGDECHVAFHFPLMPRLFMSLAMEDRFPIIDILQQTPPIPENCQWALFLRNHDELTLEMVTDEDRDYMYRTYARDQRARINLGIRRRLAPLLGNHRRRVELMNALLFSFPGVPIIYYGDEIGMGDNIYLGDRNGVRTPMQWSPDRNAGFSKANPQRLFLPTIIDPEYHFEAINVEAQQNNSTSLLWWMKRLIDLRKRHHAFGRGNIEFFHPDNRKVLAFARSHEGETILVIANLSRFVQCVSLDLSMYRGSTPVEMFGRTEFPQITEVPYFLTMAPHGFYWLLIRDANVPMEGRERTTEELPILSFDKPQDLFSSRQRDKTAAVLLEHVRGQRWFAGKAREISRSEITEVVPLPKTNGMLVFLHVDYREGSGETYSVPISFAFGKSAERVTAESPSTRIARVRRRNEEGVAFDAAHDREFGAALLAAFNSKKSFPGEEGVVSVDRTSLLREICPPGTSLEPNVARVEQSNTSIIYGDRLFLKLYRKLEAGTHPDAEVGRYLTEKTTFRNLPKLAATLEYEKRGEEPFTLGLLQQYVPNGGDAWSLTLDSLGQYFERLVEAPLTDQQIEETLTGESVVDLAMQPIPSMPQAIIGAYSLSAETIGKRTGEMHLALAAEDEDPAFRPEPFTPHYQRSLYQQMRTQTVQTFQLLRKKLKDLPENVREQASEVLSREDQIQDRFRVLVDEKIRAIRTRRHGDYHLGQMLYTGKDFIIIDFEGEPARPLSERRIKRSPITDVAGMIRSFYYAPYAVLYGQAAGLRVRVDDIAALDLAARYWQTWVSAIFLRSYLTTVGESEVVPPSKHELTILIDAYVLHKALYELSYELNSRPTWVTIPLRGILDILEAPTTTE